MGVIESKYPVLVLSFNNCELHCCHLDGYKSNNEALLNRLQLIDDYFSKNPKGRRYRIWYNVDDSDLSNDDIDKIAKSISVIRENVIKLAFIGMNNRYKIYFNRLLSKSSFYKPVKHFKDAELAKHWLV